MAELSIATAGIALQGLHLLRQFNKFRTSFQDVESTFKDVKSELATTTVLIGDLKLLVDDFQKWSISASRDLCLNLSNFRFELDMLSDVYTSLEKLLEIYHEPPIWNMISVLQPLNFVRNQVGMGLGKKLKWMTGGQDQAENLRKMLIGHKANLSFAIQVAQYSLQISEARKRELSQEAMNQKIDEVTTAIAENQKILEEMKRASSTPGTPNTPCSCGTPMSSPASITQEALRRREFDFAKRDSSHAKKDDKAKKRENAVRLVGILHEHLDSLKVRRRDSIDMQNSDDSHLRPSLPPPEEAIASLGSTVSEADVADMHVINEGGSPALRLEDPSRIRTGAAEKEKRAQVVIQIVINGILRLGTTVMWRGNLIVDFFVWVVLFLSVMLVWIGSAD